MLKASCSGVAIPLSRTNAKKVVFRVGADALRRCRGSALSYRTSPALSTAQAASMTLSAARSKGGETIQSVDRSPGSSSSFTDMLAYPARTAEEKSRNVDERRKIPDSMFTTKMHPHPAHRPAPCANGQCAATLDHGQHDVRDDEDLDSRIPGGRVVNEMEQELLERAEFIARHQRILRTSSSVEEAWNAYRELVSCESDVGPNHGLFDLASRNGQIITEDILFRLSNLLTRSKLRSRTEFPRLLSVLSRLRKLRRRHDACPPYLRTSEWNALIHFAGIGLRKTKLEHYSAALDIYHDMLRNAADLEKARESVSPEVKIPYVVPDIVTYTTLLNIAVKTYHGPAVEHAMKLLRESGCKPTRKTRLCVLLYRQKRDGLLGMRDGLLSLVEEGFEIGIDGVNAFMFCAGSEGRFDIAVSLYQELRRNIPKTLLSDIGRSGSRSSNDKDRIGLSSDPPVPSGNAKAADVEGIPIPSTLLPDETTYTCLIQTLAYHGFLIDALEVFSDMLITRRGPHSEENFKPTHAIFRAFFCAFAKHGVQNEVASDNHPRLFKRKDGWNWGNLEIILDAYFRLSTHEPSERMVYWIMRSVQRVAEDDCVPKDIWIRLNERFKIRKGGRLRDLEDRYGNAHPS